MAAAASTAVINWRMPSHATEFGAKRRPTPLRRVMLDRVTFRTRVDQVMRSSYRNGDTMPSATNWIADASPARFAQPQGRIRPETGAPEKW